MMVIIDSRDLTVIVVSEIFIKKVNVRYMENDLDN